MRMKWYDGKHWHWGNALSPKAKAKVYGHEFIVLVGSRDQRGLSFDEVERLPGHWREAESHASAVQAAEEEVEYWGTLFLRRRRKIGHLWPASPEAGQERRGRDERIQKDRGMWGGVGDL